MLSVGDITSGEGLGFFGQGHRALGPNRNGSHFVYSSC